MEESTYESRVWLIFVIEQQLLEYTYKQVVTKFITPGPKSKGR
jgi:hypothetical protein